MQNHQEEVKTTLEWYRQNLSSNDIDLFVTDAESSRARYLNNLTDLNLGSLGFYGSISNREMLQQFQT
ncbi:MAG: hypothetical protein ACFCAD_15965 [Pleurocapsa sp.]